MNRSQRRANDARRRAADSAMAAALRKHEAELQTARAKAAKALCDPAKNEALGLPRELPLFTVDVLSRTQALSKVGPRRPRRDRIYEQHGVI